MIDKRSLLLGLGIGLIAGALLLQLMLAGKEQSERLADIGRLSGEEELYTRAELDALIAEAEDRIRRQLGLEPAAEGAEDGAGGEESDGMQADGAEPDGLQPDGAEPDDAAAQAETGGTNGAGDSRSDGGETSGAAGGQPDGTGEKAAGEDSGGITVRIKPGMTLTQTARLLESEGVIGDADALMELMSRMSTKIRAGYYTFTGGETLEEVRTIITSPPAE